jgi:hypothetical protein
MTMELEMARGCPAATSSRRAAMASDTRRFMKLLLSSNEWSG